MRSKEKLWQGEKCFLHNKSCHRPASKMSKAFFVAASTTGQPYLLLHHHIGADVFSSWKCNTHTQQSWYWQTIELPISIISNTSQSNWYLLTPKQQISLRGSHPDHLPTSRDSSQPSIFAFPNAPPAVGSCWRDGSNNENPSFYLFWFRFVG